MRRPTTVLACAALVAATLVGCSSSDDVDDADDPPGTSTPPTSPSTTAFDAAGAYAPGGCPAEVDPGVQVTCGTVTVPLHHDRPDAGTIALAVAVVPSRVEPGGEPVVLLGGGPGEHTLVPLLGALTPESPLLELTARRDLVLLDQRGVGASRPALECPELVAALAQVTETEGLAGAAIDGVTACRARLVGEGIDLSAFHTAADVADLDVLRQALGYEQVSLFGTSYGARLALQAVRAAPEGISSAVLSSPIPAEANLLLDAARSFDRAVAAVGATCADDVACAREHGDVAAEAVRLVEELDRAPAAVTVTDPATGMATQVPIDGATLATALFGTFYLPGGPAAFPALITSLAEGGVEALGSLASRPAAAVVSQGAQLSFFCAEEAAVAGPDDLALGELGLGERIIDTNPIVGRTLWDLCDVWDVEPAGGEVFEPVETDVPLLVVTGEFDQITPPAYGEEVAAAARGPVTYLEVPQVGHSPLLAAGPCGVAILAAFVGDPTADDLDAGCEPSGPDFLSSAELAEASAAGEGGP